MPAAKTATRPPFRCSDCGVNVPKWVGRCPECQAWGTVVEIAAPRLQAVAAGSVTASARPIAEIDATAASARSTGIDEFDRVLGGGLVRGSVVLLAGEPGVGKSTLILEAAARAATDGAPSLVVTGEESAAQVRLRADRVGAISQHLFLAAEADVGAVIAHIDAVKPALLVVDSVQTMSVDGLDGSAGGVTQVREVAGALARIGRERGIATVLIGHVTKEGSIAGPRVLEHLVDVVLQFEGDRHTPLRIVRAIKNRFGPTDEVGCFLLDGDGVRGLPDPSGLFLTERSVPVAGTAVTVALEGRRPLVAEVQALVAPVGEQSAIRRTTSGIASSRLAMVLAVLEQRASVKVSRSDVYAATTGGIRLTEPAADLSIALAVAGAAGNKALDPGVIAFGEVGLAGDVRPVIGVERRLAEAARLGFTRALVPPDPGRVPAGIAVTEVRNIARALWHLAPPSGG